MTSVQLRAAGVDDAEQVAFLHADSWQRHYRGAYSDGFLDGDVITDRREVWQARFRASTGTATVLAEDGSTPVGFVHVIFDEDRHWGSLIDNLHVRHGHQRTGLGSALLGRAAQAVIEQASTDSMYLWVLQQNIRAQRFYQACGGVCVETAPVPPPGGDPSRLNGAPNGLRYAWPEVRSQYRH